MSGRGPGAWVPTPLISERNDALASLVVTCCPRTERATDSYIARVDPSRKPGCRAARSLSAAGITSNPVSVEPTRCGSRPISDSPPSPHASASTAVSPLRKSRMVPCPSGVDVDHHHDPSSNVPTPSARDVVLR